VLSSGVGKKTPQFAGCRIRGGVFFFIIIWLPAISKFSQVTKDLFFLTRLKDRAKAIDSPIKS